MIDLTIRRDESMPLHQQIALGLRRLIATGRLADGAHLPPSRQLASDLGVNRGTVVQAYERLQAEGLAAGHVGRGTVVCSATGYGSAAAQRLSWRAVLGPADTVSAARAVAVAEDLTEKAPISFAAGFPSSELYPMAQMVRATTRLLRSRGGRLLSEGPVQGLPELRAAVADELGCGPNEVFVVSGSQQGLYLLGRALLRRGDAVVTEVPTYLGALQVFQEVGARVIGLPIDEAGMDPTMLEDVLSRMTVRLLYTVPTFQNPTGASLSLERRRAVLELAYRYGVPIVEDDPYALLAYDGECPPTLRSLDRQGHVLYVSTCSKTLFPGLRVGWVTAPEPLVKHLVPMKLRMDLFTSPLAQAVVTALRAAPEYGRHLNGLRDAYRSRREAMVAGLRRHCPGIAFSVPRGGYFIWGRLPEGVDAVDLLRESTHEGVSFLPGEFFYPEGQSEEAVRLTFVSEPEERIHEGTARLGRALRRVAEQGRVAASGGVHQVEPIV